MAADDIWDRSTAPQTAYTNRQVGFGLVVAAVLFLLAFVVPIALV